jgi:hypothetical protein
MSAALRILIVALPLAAAALTVSRKPNLIPDFTISPYGLA